MKLIPGLVARWRWTSAIPPVCGDSRSARSGSVGLPSRWTHRIRGAHGPRANARQSSSVAAAPRWNSPAGTRSNSRGSTASHAGSDLMRMRYPNPRRNGRSTHATCQPCPSGSVAFHGRPVCQSGRRCRQNTGNGSQSGSRAASTCARTNAARSASPVSSR